jgi:hypothetical protein
LKLTIFAKLVGISVKFPPPISSMRRSRILGENMFKDTINYQKPIHEEPSFKSPGPEVPSR